MEEPISGLPAESADTLELGVVLGHNQAFGLIAGRCSAAQAASLRRLREEKKYRSCNLSWNEFCTRYLKVSRTQADKTIRLLEEFGPSYFTVAQMTRISPDAYRAIEPAVKDGAIHVDGEAIELIPENAHKVAAAVAGLRNAMPPKKPAARQLEMHERLAELDKRCAAAIRDFDEIARKERHGENWLQLAGILARHYAEVARLSMENGIV